MYKVELILGSPNVQTYNIQSFNSFVSAFEYYQEQASLIDRFKSGCVNFLRSGKEVFYHIYIKENN